MAERLFKALGLPPAVSPRLLWQSRAYGTRLSTLHALCGSNGATVLLLKVGDQLLGGYAAQPWNSSGVSFGGPGCCVFSLSRDMLVPCSGQDGLRATNSSLQWANALVIREGFKRCSSHLGAPYSVSSDMDGSSLVGVPEFSVDEAEVWNFEN
eukprot:gnl/Dysnectes_brevis/341_a376_3976.p1 GENE.gnl/Dysnectes_brevis/341_a376_3976~~gnl/Dysnectes_brevis/341_a376_3976.p1  ORF type:complete len:153 (-),score=54.40 gnl/Dysnectes_brevis/341_a376_3976:594-1052(-)